MRALIMLLLLIFMASGEITEHAGYPQPQPINIANAITISDLNNDSIPEIITAPHSRSVKVYDPDGNMLWKGIAGIETASNTVSPLAANISGDSNLEVLLTGGVPGDRTYLHRLYIWNSQGTLLRSFDIGNGNAPSSPAYADGLILIGISGSYTGLYAYDMNGFKWSLPFAGGSERMNSIAIDDLDGDGTSEAVLAGGGKVTVVEITPSGGSVRWQKDVPEAISPVIINVSGKKLVAASGSSGTFAWDASGEPVWSSARGAGYYFNTYSSPAVYDLNNDGSEDLIIASDYDVYALSGTDGNTLFKVSSVTSPPGTFRSRPAVYDMDGGSKIILGDSNGNLYIWDSGGSLIDGFPVRITDRVKPLHSSPAVYDLEGDGIPEVAIGSATHLHVISVKVKSKDTAPPVTSDDADGKWHNSSVTVTLTPVDELSGVFRTYYTTDGSDPDASSSQGTVITLNDEGSYTIKYFSTDNAGNIEPVKMAMKVMIDRTPPTTEDDSDGWYNNSALVTLAAHDNVSGVAATYYTLNGGEQVKGNMFTINGEGIHSIRYYSVDNAGNAGQNREVMVKIDSTPPVTADGSDSMWHSSDVSINLTARDDLSGIAHIHYRVNGVEAVSHSENVQLAFADEGMHAIEYYSTDNAGNIEAVKTAVVKIDKTPPSTSDDSDGEWHNRSVTVNLEAIDSLSGVNATDYRVSTDSVIESFFAWLAGALGLGEGTSRGNAVTISGEGVFIVRYRSTDNAGNREEDRLSGQVKIDRTPPDIVVNSPEAKTYLHSDIITLEFNAQDALAGVKTVDPGIDGIEVANAQELDMLSMSFGEHEFYISAEDNAGNFNVKRIRFNVTATIQSLRALTQRGEANGGITSRGVANSLEAKLNSAEAKLKSGQRNAAANMLEAYVSELDAQSGRYITPEWAGILKAEAGYVMERI